MLGSKRALRRSLAARPLAEKLRMLDALRERERAIRGRGGIKDEGKRKKEEKAEILNLSRDKNWI